MAALADRECVPCTGTTPRLTAAQIEPLLAQLAGWSVVDGHHLYKEYRLPDFAAALDLVNRIGAVAEHANHHPDLFLAWGKVGVKIWTHVIDGLSESDFVLAAQCERARSQLGS